MNAGKDAPSLARRSFDNCRGSVGIFGHYLAPAGKLGSFSQYCSSGGQPGPVIATGALWMPRFTAA